MMPRAGRRLAVLVLSIGCGPVVGHPSGEGSAEGGSTGGGSGGASASSASTASPTATSIPPMTSSVDGDDDGPLDEGVKVDFVDGIMGDVGGPTICTLPRMLDANIIGSTPLGDVVAHAAVFAAIGGGRCEAGFRVLAAADLDVLADEIERGLAGMLPLDAVVVDLVPPMDPQPGEWPAVLTVWIEGESWTTNATMLVTAFAGPDADVPVIEGLVTGADPDWMVHGPFTATWCDDVGSPPCP